MVIATQSFKSYPAKKSKSEIDLRQELINTINGNYPEIAKGRDGLLRTMQRDKLGKLVKCVCVDRVTNEPDKDAFCGICYGEGFLWTETALRFYKVILSDQKDFIEEEFRTPGTDKLPLVAFYLPYDTEITVADKIIELKLDIEGAVVLPARRSAVYRMNSLVDFRSDYGRLEYWKAKAVKEDVKYLNHPGNKY